MDILTSLSKLYSRFGSEHHRGDVVFRENDAGSDMYFILEGNVEVVKRGKGAENSSITLGTLGPSDFFGEMSLLNREVRSATIRVVSEKARIVRISHGNFDTMIKLQPQIAIVMLEVLARRLRSADAKVSEATPLSPAPGP